MNFDCKITEFDETLEWQQDQLPRARGNFAAAVLHGAPMSETAGPSRGTFAADPWTVIIAPGKALATQIAVGDTLRRLSDDKVLSVQQIARDPFVGWILTCTANERGPR